MQRHIFFAVIVGSVFAGKISSAGLSEQLPYSWMAFSANEEYIFVGVSKFSVDEQVKMLLDDDIDQNERAARIAKIRDVHKRFPVTGMYANDGSHIPLWTMSRWESHGLVSSDGENLVVIGEGAYGNDSQRCIARIYDRNGLVRRLSDTDLVPGFEMKLRNYFANYVSFDDFGICGDGKRLFIKTSCDDRIEVFLGDGQIVRRNTLSRTLFLVGGNWVGQICILAIFMFLSVIGWLFVYRRGK